MTASEAARRLECSPRYVRLLCERGELPAWKIGRSGWRISEQSVEAFRAGLMNAPEVAAPPAERSAPVALGVTGLPKGYKPVFPELWT